MVNLRRIICFCLLKDDDGKGYYYGLVVRWVLEVFVNVVFEGNIGGFFRFYGVLELGFFLVFSFFRVGEVVKNRKNWFFMGRERKKGGG